MVFFFKSANRCVWGGGRRKDVKVESRVGGRKFQELHAKLDTLASRIPVYGGGKRKRLRFERSLGGTLQP